MHPGCVQPVIYDPAGLLYPAGQLGHAIPVPETDHFPAAHCRQLAADVPPEVDE